MRPFDLLAFDFRQGFSCQRQRWDGQTLQNLAVPPVLSSSSYLSRQIERARIAHFEQLEQSQGKKGKNSNSLLWHLRYHTAHQPKISTGTAHSVANHLGNAASVCMHRDISG